MTMTMRSSSTHVVNHPHDSTNHHPHPPHPHETSTTTSTQTHPAAAMPRMEGQNGQPQHHPPPPPPPPPPLRRNPNPHDVSTTPRRNNNNNHHHRHNHHNEEEEEFEGIQSPHLLANHTIIKSSTNNAVCRPPFHPHRPNIPDHRKFPLIFPALSVRVAHWTADSLYEKVQRSAPIRRLLLRLRGIVQPQQQRPRRFLLRRLLLLLWLLLLLLVGMMMMMGPTLWTRRPHHHHPLNTNHNHNRMRIRIIGPDSPAARRLQQQQLEEEAMTTTQTPTTIPHSPLVLSSPPRIEIIRVHSRSEQRAFLQQQHGADCYQASFGGGGGDDGGGGGARSRSFTSSSSTTDRSSSSFSSRASSRRSSNSRPPPDGQLFLNRFDALSDALATELYKYCRLYTTTTDENENEPHPMINIWWDMENFVPVMDVPDVWKMMALQQSQPHYQNPQQHWAVEILPQKSHHHYYHHRFEEDILFVEEAGEEDDDDHHHDIGGGEARSHGVEISNHNYKNKNKINVRQKIRHQRKKSRLISPAFLLIQPSRTSSLARSNDDDHHSSTWLAPWSWFRFSRRRRWTGGGGGRSEPTHSGSSSSRPRVLTHMMRAILESPIQSLTMLQLAEWLGLFISDDHPLPLTRKAEASTGSRAAESPPPMIHHHPFAFFQAQCEWTGEESPLHPHSPYHADHRMTLEASTTTTTTTTCPLVNRPCCQVWMPEDDETDTLPSFFLHEPFVVSSHDSTTTTSTATSTATALLSSSSQHLLLSLPYALTAIKDDDDEDPLLEAARLHEAQLQRLTMPSAEELPFIATVREHRFIESTTRTTDAEEDRLDRILTPNFFDIVADNNCLPEGSECFRCLKKYGCPTTAATTTPRDGGGGGVEDSSSSSTTECSTIPSCRCYCQVLCNIRPPPKPIRAEWLVTLPRRRLANDRLIPRIIHQTWYEPITSDKYPNMSRLIASWQNLVGWQYQFYDDAQAAEFLSTHFPPQVRESYDALIPGAFKADLFRYCVLLIRGGVYADMDVMLDSNLDEALAGNIGFVTAQDEPGMQVGHRSCLWNGLLASAPGHPFMARTIENVVNGIQNRYTSLDYDDRLCPNPVLTVSHTIDMLFTCGPCVLGLSINQILQRHPQTSFEFGEMDVFHSEDEDNDDGTYPSSAESLAHHARGGGSFRGDTTTTTDDDTTNEEYDPRSMIPGRSFLLAQDKTDMGAHRFTWREKHTKKLRSSTPSMVVASTDLPDSDDRPKSLVHYSRTHEKFGIYGLNKLYTNDKRSNEEIRIRVLPN